MGKTKIEWCNWTVNCVQGCPNNCDYCYGKVLNKRFHYCEDWSKPEWKPKHLKDFYKKKPKSIFIDSMSDIGCWRYEWFEAVMDAVRENPQHTYQALSKRPARLLDMRNKYCLTRDAVLKNVYFGTTITSDADIVTNATSILYMDFLSIEPLLAPLKQLNWVLGDGSVKVVIIGAETGNRKGKVIPQKEWVDEIVKCADKYGKQVFMKGSLREIMGADFRQDKLIWEVHQ